jgi:hypothetical protein
MMMYAKKQIVCQDRDVHWAGFGGSGFGGSGFRVQHRRWPHRRRGQLDQKETLAFCKLGGKRTFEIILISNNDGLVKSQKFHLLSFRRKPESSLFKSFWTQVFAGVTELGLFTNSSIMNSEY